MYYGQGGNIYFVELKRPGGKTSKIQDIQIDLIRKLGFKVYVIDDLEGVEKFINGIGGEEK